MLLDGDRPIAPGPKAEKKERKYFHLFLGLFLGIPLLFFIALDLSYPSIFSRWFPGIRAMRMGSESMAPAVNKNDSIIINFLAYDRKDPQRGDIVCFEQERDDKPIFNIKRVVAVGGDVIAISGKHIVLNGRMIAEPFIFQDSQADEALASQGSNESRPPFQVPPKQYYLLGDNRDNSFDSRYYGAVDRSRIRGKAISVIRADDPTKQWKPLR